MTQVQLYQLRISPLEKVLPKLVEKACGSGHRVLIVEPDEGRRAMLDTALWTYEQLSFLPHGMAEDKAAASQPVLLASTLQNKNQAQIAVMTGEAPPLPPEGWQRIVHIVEAGSGRMEALLKHYQSAGLAPTRYEQQQDGAWKQAA